MKNKVLLLILMLCNLLHSQINIDLKEENTSKWLLNERQKLNYADKYFSNQEYLFARPIYDSLYKKHKSNVYIGYLLGTCSVYDAKFQNVSESLIKAAESIKTKLPDYDYYLGKALLANEKCNEAIAQFEKYKMNPLNKDVKNEVEHQIAICKSAISLNNKSSVAKITNIGPPVNTAGSEYTPVFPSNESFMVFTYRGEKSMGGKQILPNRVDMKNGIYFEDVMISHKNNFNNWTEPIPITAINTNGHDAVVHISHDGQRLFTYRNIGVGSGDIYVSKLDGYNWGIPEKVKGINSNFWEGSVCLSPDEKTIYFSSDRQGGLGGRDIYFAQLLADGSWGNVKNLGPEINTSFDEDAPFIHADGKTLFFASTGHNTIGGYDVFRSELKLGKWTTPYNVGKPVNTAQDDKFYIVSSDGERGYYSTEKKDGKGLQDIYMVEPGLFGKPTSLVLVTGNVKYDNAPVKAEIFVRSKLNRKDFSGIFNSNSITGGYLVNLPSGNEYEIIYKYLNTTITKAISTAKIDSFAKIEIDAELFSVEYLRMNNTQIDSSAFQPDDLRPIGLTYEELLAKYGETVIDSLDYTVQIGAYKIFENFNYSKLIGLPKTLRRTLPDNITRFTLGSYTTLNETNAILSKAKKNGIKDAFVIAIYKGEKYYFQELLNQGILK
ncbi:MAG: PD40 domain-containing protein [Burkholderiales bacterium]|nr:PD40 domain-containing protein [Bacteroidia bacterium]